MCQVLTEVREKSNGKFVLIRPHPMGETLAPYQPLGLIKVSLIGPQQTKLTRTGTATKNYKVLGTHNPFDPPNFSNWQTVAQDFPGADVTDAMSVKSTSPPRGTADADGVLAAPFWA